MSRPADAIVTGFAKSQALAEQSLAPLRRLRAEGVLRRIHCVTWDNPDMDDYAAWIGAMGDVELARVPQPEAGGTGNQRNVVYQVENLRAALARVPDDGDLVLKLRPDFIGDADFLRNKIATFDSWAAIPSRSIFGITMPGAQFANKIWIPWADSNQPFFYEDAAFLGNKRDLERLIMELSPQDIEMLGEKKRGSYAHVVRFARSFLTSYPLFARYMREYRCFVNDMDYRLKLVPHMLNDGFFWHLIVAHAWILHSHFHVDAGNAGELRFYANTVNRHADWSNPKRLNLANPYDRIELWRAGTHPGGAFNCLLRVYGRLMDDDWQRALFSQTLSDFPRATLTGILENVAACRDGRLNAIEAKFYDGLNAFYRAHAAAPLAKIAS